MSSDAKNRGSVFDRLGSKKNKSHSKEELGDDSTHKSKSKLNKEKNCDKETDSNKKEKSKGEKSADKVKSLIVPKIENSDSLQTKKRKTVDGYKEEPAKKKKTKSQHKDRDSPVESSSKSQEKVRDREIESDKRHHKADPFYKEDLSDNTNSFQKSIPNKNKSEKQTKKVRSPKSSSKDASQPPVHKAQHRSSSYNSCISSNPSDFDSAAESDHDNTFTKSKNKKSIDQSHKSKYGDERKDISKKSSKRYESPGPEIKESKKAKRDKRSDKKERYSDQMDTSPHARTRDDQYYEKHKRHSDNSKTKDDYYSKYDYPTGESAKKTEIEHKRKYDDSKMKDAGDYKQESSKRKLYDQEEGKSSKYYQDSDDSKHNKYYKEDSEEVYKSRKDRDRSGRHLSSSEYYKQSKDKGLSSKHDYHSSKNEDNKTDRSKKSDRRSDTAKKDDRTMSSRDRERDYKSRNYKKDFDRRSRDCDRRIDDRYDLERGDSIDRKDKTRPFKSNERKSKFSYRDGSNDRHGAYSKISEDEINDKKEEDFEAEGALEAKPTPFAELIENLDLDEVSDTELDDLPVLNQTENGSTDEDTKEVDIDLQTWDSEEETTDELFRLAGEGDPPPRHRGILESLKVPWKSLVEESAVMKESEVKDTRSSLNEIFLPGNLLLKCGLSKRFAGIDLWQRAMNSVAEDPSEVLEHEIPGIHLSKRFNKESRVGAIRRYAHYSGALSARKDSAIRLVLSDISVES